MVSKDCSLDPRFPKEALSSVWVKTSAIYFWIMLKLGSFANQPHARVLSVPLQALLSPLRAPCRSASPPEDFSSGQWNGGLQVNWESNKCI